MKMKAFLLVLGTASALVPASALAGGVKLTPVPAAMPKVDGMAVPSALSPELIQIPAAQGAMPLENPTKLLSHYGFAADGRWSRHPIRCRARTTRSRPPRP